MTSYAMAVIVTMVAMMAMMVVGQYYETYEGYKVVRLNIEQHKHVKQIEEWELDVWSRDSVLCFGVNDIRVNQTHMDKINEMGITYEVLIDDLSSLISSERDSLSHRSFTADTWFTTYHTYPEIVARLQYYSTSYPSLVQYNKSIGKTVQGNNIPAVIVSGSGSNKVNIFWSCQQHAREWIASHTCMYIIDQLVTLYSTDTSVKQLLDNSVIHIVPLVNPDGYLYTWSSTRLWRKNRRANSGGSYGVDLNRNWDDHWGGAGSSGTQTSDTYRGTKAFSEPESTAVSNYVSSHGPFDGAIDWHSYSQLILRPYGWTESYPSNEKELKHVADTMRDRLYAVNKVTYTSIASWELYFTTGSAQDWYFSEGSIPLSYTFELRDTGKYGFVLPASEIIPSGKENYAAAKYFVDYIISNS